MKPVFSIIILTKNSAGIVNRLVDKILAQEFDHSFELIFMDNDSTDSTIEYLNSIPFENKKIINVPEGTFSHSRTRMDGAKQAAGEFLIFFTDDIVPADNTFLRNLTEPLISGKADAAYGVCLINPEEHDPVDAYIHNTWHKGADDLVYGISDYAWKRFTPQVRRQICNFDNCSSVIRKDTLLDLKFPDVPYGEDMLFAKRLLLKGGRLALSKNAEFYHWHKVTFRYLMKRMCIDQHLSIPEFEIFYVTRKIQVIKAIAIRVLHRTYISFFKLSIPFSKKIYWALYNIKVLCADFTGKYMGVLTVQGTKGFNPVNKKLFRLKEKFVDEVYKRSIHRG